MKGQSSNTPHFQWSGQFCCWGVSLALGFRFHLCTFSGFFFSFFLFYIENYIYIIPFSVNVGSNGNGVIYLSSRTAPDSFVQIKHAELGTVERIHGFRVNNYVRMQELTTTLEEMDSKPGLQWVP
jgi:hypothetical protein